MTSHEYRYIWVPALVKNYDVGGDRDCFTLFEESKHLERLLNCKEFSIYMAVPLNRETPLPENIKSTLKALAGPHSATIYKALVLKKRHANGG